MAEVRQLDGPGDSVFTDLLHILRIRDPLVAGQQGQGLLRGGSGRRLCVGGGTFSAVLRFFLVHQAVPPKTKKPPRKQELLLGQNCSLALAELESAAGALLTVLFAFNHAAVACKESVSMK